MKRMESNMHIFGAWFGGRPALDFSAPALGPEQLRNSPVQRMHCVPYTSVRRQLGIKDPVRLSQQHRWGRTQLLQREVHEWQVLKAASVADAQLPSGGKSCKGVGKGGGLQGSSIWLCLLKIDVFNPHYNTSPTHLPIGSGLHRPICCMLFLHFVADTDPPYRLLSQNWDW